jgi:hypothetical protein
MLQDDYLSGLSERNCWRVLSSNLVKHRKNLLDKTYKLRIQAAALARRRYSKTIASSGQSLVHIRNHLSPI